MMEKYKNIKLASIFSIIGNIFLFIIKLVMSIMSKSVAMISDTLNSGTDIVSSLMTFIGSKLSSKPEDDDHNLGHGKAEYIYSLLISVIMIFSSIILLKDAILSIINKIEYIYSNYLIIVCIITIITKLCLYIYTNKLYKKYDNLLIKANSIDHRNDMVLTFFNMISILLAKRGIFIFDGIVGAILAIWIIITAFKIFKESYDVLMDKSIDNSTKDEVYNIINKYKEIKRVNHFNSTPVGYKYQISFTIYVDGKLSTFKSHDIANKLEKEITNNIDEIYLTVIHVNPIEEENK